MGCCASANKAASAPHIHRHSSFTQSSRAPHPSLEEETVKEVLSETPTPKPSFPKIEDEAKKTIPIPVLHKNHKEDRTDNNVDKKPTPTVVVTEEISEEISEICSSILSETVSTATVTEDGEVRQRVDRSPAKYRNQPSSGDWKRPRVVGKSPARRTEPGPGRIRSIPGGERHGQRQDSGENSGRRSSSPAIRTDSGTTRLGVGRSPSARRTGKSPSRVKSDVPEKNRQVEDGNREGKWPPTTNESLENPLVSLECFIFL